MVLVSCEDPGALSSTNEGDSRPYAKMMEFPLVEPGDFQEAKDMARWSFELSEELRTVVMLRSVTRLSHASGNLTLGELPPAQAPPAHFECRGGFMDQLEGPVVTFPSLVEPMHARQLDKLARARELFEDSPFNTYDGPESPELLVITSSAACLYAKEAIAMLGAADRVGLLKLGTTWPLPPRLLAGRLAAADKVLVVEEGTPFLEDNVKALAAERAAELGAKAFYGRKHGDEGAVLPSVNELNPDLVASGLARVLGQKPPAREAAYEARAVELARANAPARALTFCPGCPHRASYWLINQALKEDARQGFVCGDIGCYTLGAISCGFNALKTSHAMGSGAGVASGFGQLGRFGLDQPVMAICGDSTFFHAVLPAVVNAVHNQADMILVVVDNSGTAMTGFQPHPGTPSGAAGGALPAVDIPAVCRAMGAEVVIADPFEMAAAGRTVRQVVGDAGGVRVLVLRQACALSPGKKGKKLYDVSIDPQTCLGQECGCNRLCTRVFRCPGLIWDPEEGVTRIDEVICVGCGVCADICPSGAIRKEEVA
jgi:indolepyruvate ferredoxin oxidoreductase alpha subunit